MSGSRAIVRVEPARPEWLEALVVSDAAFTDRFGIEVLEGWVGFPEALAPALASVRADPSGRWGTHLFFDSADGALVGLGGWKGEPIDGAAELGYAIAPERQGRGLATAVVEQLVERGPKGSLTTVVAHTLGEENASVAVLRKCGFERVAEIEDPDEGPIWRWERELA